MRRAPAVAAASQPSRSRVNPGDEVRLTMRDGRRAQFTVHIADTATITARDGTTYEVADVVALERRQFSWAKTTFMVFGILAGFVWLPIGLAYAALADNI